MLARSTPQVLQVRRDTIAAAETTTGYSVNTWHHAAGTFTSTTARAAFIDGGSKGTDTTSIVPANENRISIGRWGDSTPGNYMSGRICEVGLWDVVLTDDEISALARGVTPNRVRPANLKGYWPVWGLHSPEIDLSGNGNSLAVTGAVKADHAPVTLYTPKWAASVPLVEADAGGGFAHSQAVIVA